MTDHVLDAIDAALRDWETSDDAMRCSYADELPPVEDRATSSTGVDVSGWRELGYITDEPEAFHRQPRNYAAWMSMMLCGEVFIDQSTGAVIDPSRVTVTRVNEREYSMGPFHVRPIGETDLRAMHDRLRAPLEELSGVMAALSQSVKPVLEGMRAFSVAFDASPLHRQTPAATPPQMTPRERALNARLNRHNGPQRDPHRHRGL